MAASLDQAFQELLQQRESLDVIYVHPDHKITDTMRVYSDMGHIMMTNNKGECVLSGSFWEMVLNDITGTYTDKGIAVFNTVFSEKTKQYQHHDRTITVDFTGL